MKFLYFQNKKIEYVENCLKFLGVTHFLTFLKASINFEIIERPILHTIPHRYSFGSRLSFNDSHLRLLRTHANEHWWSIKEGLYPFSSKFFNCVGCKQNIKPQVFILNFGWRISLAGFLWSRSQLDFNRKFWSWFLELWDVLLWYFKLSSREILIMHGPVTWQLQSLEEVSVEWWGWESVMAMNLQIWVGNMQCWHLLGCSLLEHSLSSLRDF